MIDAISNAGTAMKGQLTMKPEQLQTAKLEQAKGLATVLTGVRKGLYFAFPLFTTAIVIDYVSSTVTEYGYGFLVVMLIAYALFKLRDLIRGTI
jgi:hypothetical protein